MRRLVLLLALFSLTGLIGCEKTIHEVRSNVTAAR
jgi:hypothetical protein